MFHGLERGCGQKAAGKRVACEHATRRQRDVKHREREPGQHDGQDPQQHQHGVGRLLYHAQ
jgi:hypothetical protein